MNRLLVLIVGLLLSLFARAADTIQEQGYLLHYSAINTLSLTEDIARQFGIKRRKSHAIFLLSPRAQNALEAGSDPVRALASGTVRRLTGQRQTLQWREIEIDGQFDLVAEFEIQNGEKLAFDVSVKPEGAVRPISIRFLQQFYRD